MCDSISDVILDALIEQDPMSRVACETCVTTRLVLVMGKIATNAHIDVFKIGYKDAEYGFDAKTCGVITAL